jgi:hypothetical protein
MNETEKILAKLDDQRTLIFMLSNAPNVQADFNGLLNSNTVLRRQVEKHNEEIRYVNPEYKGSFDTREEALDGWDTEVDGELEITTFSVCRSCAEINKSAMEYQDDWDFLPEVYYPCTFTTETATDLGISE